MDRKSELMNEKEMEKLLNFETKISAVMGSMQRLREIMEYDENYMLELLDDLKKISFRYYKDFYEVKNEWKNR